MAHEAINYQKIITALEQERDRLAGHNAELLAALKTVVANAPDPYCAITRAVDAQARIAIANAEQKGGE